MNFIMIVAVVALVILIAAFVGSLIVKNLLYVCTPSEVLVFSGRARQMADGSWLGYRIIKGGRSIRMPIIEAVDRIDLTNMIIEITVRNAYSRGGIPLTVQGVANIKVPGEEPMIRNTLERFLGRSREEIMRIARETLEGNLRGVLATLTPEQVNEDKEAFAQKLTEEAEHDLNRIGLVLDTLKIQNVSDDVGYLDAIGRMRSAHIRRNALIAEADAQVFEEMRASEVDRVGVRTKALTVIDGNIHEALRVVEVNAVRPPPGNKIGRETFIIDTLRVRGERFVQPGLEGLIVGDLLEPPLMSGLMCGDKDKIVLNRVVIQVVEVAGKIEEGRVFHAIVEVSHHQR